MQGAVDELFLIIGQSFFTRSSNGSLADQLNQEKHQPVQDQN